MFYAIVNTDDSINQPSYCVVIVEQVNNGMVFTYNDYDKTIN